MRVTRCSFMLTAFLVALSAAAQDESSEFDTAEVQQALSRREAFVGSNARLLGLGSAGTALASESEGAWWNPAGLSGMEGVGFSLSHHPMSTRKLYPETGIALNANLNAFGAKDAGAIGAASWLSGWGVTDAKHRVYTLGYASPKEYGVSVGVGIRHELHYLETTTLRGWGFDAGAHFDRTLREGHRLLLGLSLMNAGMGLSNAHGIRLPAEATPLTVRSGLAVDSPSGTLVAMDMDYYKDETRVVGARYRFHLGVEQSLLRDIFAVRMGYNTGLAYDQISRGIWSLGASAKRDGGRIDYAFTTGRDGRGESVESRHLLTMTVDWEPTLPAPTQRAANERPDRREKVSAPMSATDLSLILPDAPVRFVRIENDILNANGAPALFHLRNLPASWLLEIRDGAGQSVRAFEPQSRAAVAELRWDGKNAQGKPVPEGLYTWQLFTGKTPNAELLARGAVTVGKPVVPKTQPPTQGARVVTGNVSVLAGSFRDRERAETTVRSLSTAGFGSSTRIEEAQLSSGKWYRVLVGDFHDRASAEPLKKMVADTLKVEAVVFTQNP